jgi:hypothetical protein
MRPAAQSGMMLPRRRPCYVWKGRGGNWTGAGRECVYPVEGRAADCRRGGSMAAQAHHPVFSGFLFGRRTARN